VLNKSPHILFLASWYPSTEKPTHGVFIKQHALALSQFAKVSIAYAYARESSSEKIECHVLKENVIEYKLAYKKSNSILKPILHYWRAKKAYQILFEKIKQDKQAVTAIQLNVIFPVAILWRLVKKTFNVPHTIVEHWSGYLPQDGNYNGMLKTYFTKKAVVNASTIFYVSEPMRKAMLNHGLKGKYQLVYNVVNTSIFKLGERSEKPLLVHISSLVEREKNISGTLEIIAQLQKKQIAFDTLIIGGSGNDLMEAQELAKKLQLTSIQFTGNLPPEQVVPHLQKAWALLLFSHFEGMPVVALEALACGVPVFASKVGHLPEIINNTNGFLGETPIEIVDALENNFQSSVKYNALSMHQWVEENASYKSVGKQLADYYKALS
jgi:L-malate glycosyltransferase